MSRWQNFLDSLNTEGGHILVLLCSVSALGVGLLLAVGWRLPDRIVDVFVAGVSGFGGALLAVLRPKERSNVENERP